MKFELIQCLSIMYSTKLAKLQSNSIQSCGPYCLMDTADGYRYEIENDSDPEATCRNVNRLYEKDYVFEVDYLEDIEEDNAATLWDDDDYSISSRSTSTKQSGDKFSEAKLKILETGVAEFLKVANKQLATLEKIEEKQKVFEGEVFKRIERLDKKTLELSEKLEERTKSSTETIAGVKKNLVEIHEMVFNSSLYLTQCSTYSTQNGWELIEVNKVLKRHEDKIQEIGKEVAREEVKPTIAAADAPPSFPTTSVISKIEEEEESANRTSGHSEGERPVVAATEGVVADRPTESSAAAAVAELSDKENGQTAEAEFLVSSASSQLPSQMLGFCFAAISLMEIYY